MRFSPTVFSCALACAMTACASTVSSPPPTSVALSSTQTIAVVPASQTATIAAGTAVANVSVPAATSGSGTVGSSASAVYATLPTLTFTLPAGTATTNETFSLYLYDPSSAYYAATEVAIFTASTTASSTVLATNGQPVYGVAFVGEPPLLPFTFAAGTTIGFVLYENPAT